MVLNSKKRWACLVLIGCIALMSCDKDQTALLIGEPSQRVLDSIADLDQTLTAAPHGWKGSLVTGNGGGYGFYMDFDSSNMVTMYADLINETALRSKTSSFEVRKISQTALVFDTYNYITMLMDPSPLVFAGQTGLGHHSDVEWEYRGATADRDTLEFQGRRYANKMILVKATQQEQEEFEQGDYAARISQTRDFFDQHPNLSITTAGLESPSVLQIDNASKTFTAVQWAGDSSMTITTPFYYSLQGIEFNEPLSLGDQTFRALVTDQAAGQLVDLNGQSHELTNLSIPLEPAHVAFGLQATYKQIQIPTLALPQPTQEINSVFPELWAEQIAYTELADARLTGMRVTLRPNDVLRVVVTLTAQRSVTLNMDMNYTQQGQIIQTGALVAKSATWDTYVLPDMADFFVNRAFKLDWIAPADGRTPILGLFDTDKPQHIFYGVAAK